MADASVFAEANYQYHRMPALYTSWLNSMHDEQKEPSHRCAAATGAQGENVVNGKPDCTGAVGDLTPGPTPAQLPGMFAFPWCTRTSSDTLATSRFAKRCAPASKRTLTSSWGWHLVARVGWCRGRSMETGLSPAKYVDWDMMKHRVLTLAKLCELVVIARALLATLQPRLSTGLRTLRFKLRSTRSTGMRQRRRTATEHKPHWCTRCTCRRCLSKRDHHLGALGVHEWSGDELARAPGACVRRSVVLQMGRWPSIG